MASLNFGYHICGGSLVNENWIITSASCFFPRFAVVKLGSTRFRLDIRLGEQNIRRTEGNEQL